MLLNNHTYFSLRYGTFSEKELLEQAQYHGYREVAITDINNTSACLNFVRLAPNYGIKPIVGIDFRNGVEQCYVGIAKNNNGFQELNAFLSHHKHTKTSFPEQAPELEDVFFVYSFEQLLLIDKSTFLPREYIGVSIDDLRKLPFSKFSLQEDRLVFMQSVSFRHNRDYNMHRLLRSIDKNSLLSKLDKNEQGSKEHKMLPRNTLVSLLVNFPFMVKNTESLVEACSIYFDFSPTRLHQNKSSYTGSAAQDMGLLMKLCKEGVSYRYSKYTKEIKERINKELGLIEKMEYVPFFLINWDIVSYAKRSGYYHVGRGSGANSIVAYLLGITDVDPLELDLYFERFMNLYRTNPPDFDIDFSWRDRQDVTRYIFERFGKEGQVALLATYNTFQYKGAVRELGKVFGLPNHEIEMLSRKETNIQRQDEYVSLIKKYAELLIGIPNHLSIHAGGVLISEKPMHYFSATDLPPKGFPTTQFDMVVAEDVGLYKYDILGQRGLGKIKDALTIVKENQPNAPEVDIHQVKPLLQDKNINKMVSKAKCIGCFYVESPAMRMLLKKLEVDTYLGLVAASSIIRPGVAQSGMMREYILRHKNPERRKKAHPVMWKLMPETYGVMVYQEDVIKVAHHFAGLDLGEADVLRRGMSGKFRSREEFHRVQEKFISNCKEKGYPDKLSKEVWSQVESFAGYAFAKGHSASYAVESYQSLYLKCYYPLEYMVAVLNNGGGYYSAEIYVHEAKMLGGRIHAPCINNSRRETSIKGKDIYLGFDFLPNIQGSISRQIIEEREENGLYLSLDNFISRIHVGINVLDTLIRINAFRFVKESKRKLLWNAYYKTSYLRQSNAQENLFEPTTKVFNLPKLSINASEEMFDQIELLGFSLGNPFQLLKGEMTSRLCASDLAAYVNQEVEIMGYLVTIKSTTTSKKERMGFGTFIDYKGGWIDTVHFPNVARKYPFRGKGIYKIKGKVVEEFGFLSLETHKMHRVEYIEDSRYALKK